MSNPLNRIPEDYIHYLWQYGLFDQEELRTTDDRTMILLKRGVLNHDSGPDFSGAQVRIGDERWAGNVEIHFKSSDWNSHSHTSDPAYNNVILHVVIHHDRDVMTEDGYTVPTLCLSTYLTIDHFRNYERFIAKKSWVPCAHQTQNVEPFKWLSLRERMAMERLIEKADRHLSQLSELNGDWEEVCFRTIARAFGSRVNSGPFEQMAERTTFSLVKRQNRDTDLIESLFLGQAGFLESISLVEDDYVDRLRVNYSFLKKKYGLTPMREGNWKNSRIRPSSLPQIRLAQLARVFSVAENIHSLIIEADQDDLRKIFSISLDGYWSDHVGLNRSGKKRNKAIGKSLIDRILINVVVPIRFAYGLFVKEFRYQESALSLLQSLEVEDNSIVRGWKKIGVEASNALDSQALIQLKTVLCDKKKCLQCAIGHELLRNNE